MGYEGYGRAVSVTPNDSNDLDAVTWGVYVGASGDLAVDMLDGTTVTFTGITAGEVHCLRIKRIYSTDTTATGIIALYHD